VSAPKVYLHYTQEELNRNFDQRSWAPNAHEVIARYPQMSAATRSRLQHRAGVAYGPGADETLDIFPAPGLGRPVQVFVHGGAWRHFGKDDYSFVAEAFVPAGIATVVLNFTNLPQIRLPGMIDQVRRALEWVHRHAQGFGGDPARIHVSAHSSGAHLAANALQQVDFVRSAALASGPYFLEPALLSHRSEYLRLEGDEVRRLSPGLNAHRLRCPVLVAYAENDTDEFRRQSREFAAGLEAAGRLLGLMACEKVNHFELMERWADPGHEWTRAMLELFKPI